MPSVHGGSDRSTSAHRRGQWTPLARALTATGNHWTLLIALGLAHGPRRPVQLRRRIAGISGAVLDRYVQQMLAAGLLSRTRYREMPPRVELELTDAGRELLPIAGALARWGMRHAWSAPAAREQVDVAALLELLPILLEGASGLPEGTLELALAAKAGAAERSPMGVSPSAPSPRLASASQPSSAQRLAIEGGLLWALEDEQAAAPDTRVHGDRRGWVLAFGPKRDLSGLEVHGRRDLVEAVFAALPETAAPVATARVPQAQAAGQRTPSGR